MTHSLNEECAYRPCRLAEKDAIKAVREFHMHLYKQMGVRLVSFVGYEDPIGEIVVCEYTKHIEMGSH